MNLAALSLSLSSLLLSPTPALPDPGERLSLPGRTAWNEPWEDTILLPGEFLLLELSSTDTSDLDLEVEYKDGHIHSSTSHLPRERLLVRGQPGERLIIRVPFADDAPADASFTLDLIPLPDPTLLFPGDAHDETTTPGCRFFQLDATLPERVRLDLTADRLDTDRGPDLDLFVFDHTLAPLALGILPGAHEQCLVDIDPAGPTYIVVSSDGPQDLSLEVERSAKRQEFPLGRLDRFLDELASTDEQQTSLAALRRNLDFLRLRFYLEHYPGGFPLRLRAAPGLRVGGVERFGSYGRGTLTINPTIDGHTENVQELMDTLIHEMVHAILDLRRHPHFPFADDVLDAAHDQRLGRYRGWRLARGRFPEEFETYLADSYGPSASNPEQDYIDINAGAQRLIVKVIEHNLAHTELGHETLVFENVRERRERLQNR